MTFEEFIAKWNIGPGMNDLNPDVKNYSGFDGTVGEGWVPILDRLASDLVSMGWDRKVAQIKEKFGGLRFYINAGTDQMYARINQAEQEASKTCEECGKPGKLRQGGWLKTYCDEHFAAYEKEQEDRGNRT